MSYDQKQRTKAGGIVLEQPPRTSPNGVESKSDIMYLDADSVSLLLEQISVVGLGKDVIIYVNKFPPKPGKKAGSFSLSVVENKTAGQKPQGAAAKFADNSGKTFSGFKAKAVQPTATGRPTLNLKAKQIGE